MSSSQPVEIEYRLKPDKVWNTCLRANLQCEIEYEQSTGKKFGSCEQAELST